MMLNCKVLCLKYSAVNCNVLRKSHEINKVTVKSPVWEHQKNKKYKNHRMKCPRCQLFIVKVIQLTLLLIQEAYQLLSIDLKNK